MKKKVKFAGKRAVKKVDWKAVAEEATEEKWNEDCKKLKLPTLEDVMSMKILKETPVEYVKLDVNMGLPFQEFLIRYADKNMTKFVKDNLFIEWAFVDILKNNLKITEK